MSDSIWDDPELKSNDDYIKFDDVGDSVSGTITSIRAHRFDDGKVVPQLLLTTDDGEEKTLTAGPIRLKVGLVEQRPEVGDHLYVEFTENEKRAGGKTLKHFNIKVTRGSGGAAPVEQVSTPAPVRKDAAPDPAAVAAALGNLTDEQKRALGL